MTKFYLALPVSEPMGPIDVNNWGKGEFFGSR
jgi:hypothetical protein